MSDAPERERLCPIALAPDLERLAAVVKRLGRREIAEMMPELRDLARDLVRAARRGE